MEAINTKYFYIDPLDKLMWDFQTQEEAEYHARIALKECHEDDEYEHITKITIYEKIKIKEINYESL